MAALGVKFGQFTISKSQLFFSNHVLVIPKRFSLRFCELTSDEVSDMMTSAQRIGALLEKHANTAALTYVIQDGKAAGQTVQHVHVHIMPRREGDFKRNDDIYDELERVDGPSRPPRTSDEMAQEAQELIKLFPKDQDWQSDVQ